MINVKFLNLRSMLERDMMDNKLWLSQKEDIEYSNFITNPANAAQVKAAKDKIISQLKAEDSGEWMERELALINQDISLRLINTRLETLQNTLRALANPNSGVTIEMFNTLQEEYLADVKLPE